MRDMVVGFLIAAAMMPFICARRGYDRDESLFATILVLTAIFLVSRIEPSASSLPAPIQESLRSLYAILLQSTLGQRSDKVLLAYRAFGGANFLSADSPEKTMFFGAGFFDASGRNANENIALAVAGYAAGNVRVSVGIE
jgi:hypothetical protein